MQVKEKKYGEINGNTIKAFTMKNDDGMEITCTNYGCIIMKIIVPDKEGNFENIVLGYETLEEYVNDSLYLGAVVGRVGGRIKDAQFELDNQTYKLIKNEHNNHIHGGVKGFSRVNWHAKPFENEIEAGVTFNYLSPDGEEGYPGNVDIKVTYKLNNENELIIIYDAVTDEKTPLTVTNHSYFNLSGNLKRDVLNHSLKLKSNKFLELDYDLIPTGKLIDVTGTPFDFTQEQSIKTGVNSNDVQNVLVGQGYDHPFLLDSNHDEEIVLKDPHNGRTLTVETDEVGVIVYSGNGLGEGTSICGIPSRKYLGICLETQGLPNAVHHPTFPSVILDKNDKYHSMTKYRFDVER